jgi:hypothetical protein
MILKVSQAITFKRGTLKERSFDVSTSEYPQLTNIHPSYRTIELFLTWSLLNDPSLIVLLLYRLSQEPAIGIQKEFQQVDAVDLSIE